MSGCTRTKLCISAFVLVLACLLGLAAMFMFSVSVQSFVSSGMVHVAESCPLREV